MKVGHFQVQKRWKGKWRNVAIWEFPPHLLSAFLTYVCEKFKYTTHEHMEAFRVQRLRYVWGDAEYSFDGEKCIDLDAAKGRKYDEDDDE